MDAHPDIPRERQAEYSALVRLLMESASPDDALAAPVADWIARASMQPGHLWRAMELENRGELRALFETHFPALAAGNTKDMRWKKYLYKLHVRLARFRGLNAPQLLGVSELRGVFRRRGLTARPARGLRLAVSKHPRNNATFLSHSPPKVSCAPHRRSRKTPGQSPIRLGTRVAILLSHLTGFSAHQTASKEER